MAPKAGKNGLTPKQERFAALDLELSNASEAYRQCYSTENMKPKQIWEEACKLRANPKVAQRQAELQAESRERTMVTIETITKELDENRLKANNLGQVPAMNTATIAKAKIHGVMVDRVEHTGAKGGPIKTITAFYGEDDEADA